MSFTENGEHVNDTQERLLSTTEPDIVLKSMDAEQDELLDSIIKDKAGRDLIMALAKSMKDNDFSKDCSLLHLADAVHAVMKAQNEGNAADDAEDVLHTLGLMEKAGLIQKTEDGGYDLAPLNGAMTKKGTEGERYLMGIIWSKEKAVSEPVETDTDTEAHMRGRERSSVNIKRLAIASSTFASLAIVVCSIALLYMTTQFNSMCERLESIAASSSRTANAVTDVSDKLTALSETISQTGWDIKSTLESKQEAEPAKEPEKEWVSAEEPDTEKGWLGVVFTEAVLTDVAGGRELNGVMITKVVPDSPADKAGLKVSDVITSVNGVTVNSVDNMVQAMKETAPGDEVTFIVFSDDGKGAYTGKSVKVTLASFENIDFETTDETGQKTEQKKNK